MYAYMYLFVSQLFKPDKKVNYMDVDFLYLLDTFYVQLIAILPSFYWYTYTFKTVCSDYLFLHKNYANLQVKHTFTTVMVSLCQKFR